MAYENLSCGFYNSDPSTHDRKYNAEQLSQIFDGIISDGVYATYEKSLIVIESSVAGEVIVQPGRAWFNHTWTLVDANQPVPAPAPGVILNRIDALCLDINTDISVRENTFVWIQGTEADNPEKPTSFEHTDTHHQYPLCYVTRRASDNVIKQADIENAVGTSECPFVTGIIETINTSDLLLQWNDQFGVWLGNEQIRFINWFEELQVILDDDVAASLAGRLLVLEDEMTVEDNPGAQTEEDKKHRIYMDYQGGKYGFNTSPSRGEETFHPFRQPHSLSYTPPGFILTTDTTVDPDEKGKTYYRYDATSGDYVIVENPTGNPSAQGLYEVYTGQLIDMGEDHEYRYLNAFDLYSSGYKNGLVQTGGDSTVEKYYHHHTISNEGGIHNNDSESQKGGAYGDNYSLTSPAGCFTKQQATYKTEYYKEKVVYVMEVRHDSNGNVWLECPKGDSTASGGVGDIRTCTHWENKSRQVFNGYRYYCGCGYNDGQLVKVVLHMKPKSQT